MPVTNWKNNAGFIISWYFLSTALSLYNKALLSTENHGLNLPLLMSAIHSGVHTVITRTLISKRGIQGPQLVFNKGCIVNIVSNAEIFIILILAKK
ncbi:hypothetical protein BDF20DRAFT_846683 [Mycotypha africana]|uniref:uncharacterized protein n=1 Tax=Mycotypha africana TaxID=64632 RepID=UPI002300217B|nr:uncharacterized protein BDF20DRAFT_846683 [Mycotypha africana]KAI8991814.1 hypothetical protein BDF20DRAFT_846683 [Mycotypha africana]